MCSYTRNNLTTSRFPINAEKVNVSRFIIRSSSVFDVVANDDECRHVKTDRKRECRTFSLTSGKSYIFGVSHRNHSDILQNLRKNVFLSGYQFADQAPRQCKHVYQTLQHAKLQCKIVAWTFSLTSENRYDF
jgi:hypothetical protein